MLYVKENAIRELVKEHKLKCSKNFLDTLDKMVYNKIVDACITFNGHKKILDGMMLR